MARPSSFTRRRMSSRSNRTLATSAIGRSLAGSSRSAEDAAHRRPPTALRDGAGRLAAHHGPSPAAGGGAGTSADHHGTAPTATPGDRDPSVPIRSPAPVGSGAGDHDAVLRRLPDLGRWTSAVEVRCRPRTATDRPAIATVPTSRRRARSWLLEGLEAVVEQRGGVGEGVRPASRGRPRRVAARRAPPPRPRSTPRPPSNPSSTPNAPG